MSFLKDSLGSPVPPLLVNGFEIVIGTAGKRSGLLKRKEATHD